jgi:hypothetical protein
MTTLSPPPQSSVPEASQGTGVRKVAAARAVLQARFAISQLLDIGLTPAELYIAAREVRDCCNDLMAAAVALQSLGTQEGRGNGAQGVEGASK